MSYERLMGALERSMFFRSERHQIKGFVSPDAEVSLHIGDAQYPLFDISISGLSFLVKQKGSVWCAGAELEIAIGLLGTVIHKSLAKVARVENSARGCRIGLEYLSGFFDPFELQRQDESMRFELALSQGPDVVREKIPERYVEQVNQAAYFIQYYARVLDRHEAALREAGASAQEVEECAQRVCDALRQPWLELCRNASRAATDIMLDPQLKLAAKEYTETVMTPLLLDCPMCHRSYTKPLGYPGDYQVMLYYYANAFEGRTLFAKIFHKFFVEHPLSNGVRTRSRYVVDLIEREIEQVYQDGSLPSFRIANLGCGPAQEIPMLVNGLSADVQTAWTLIDQEEEALALAYRSACSSIGRQQRTDVLKCLNISFSQLLREPSLMPIDEKQHVIFSTGLFDYLSDNRAQPLIAGLYARLESGGLLMVGNALGPNEHFWSPEFILDWSLIYRTREDMLRLTRDLPNSAEIEITVEPGGAYYFLLVRRHG